MTALRNGCLHLDQAGTHYIEMTWRETGQPLRLVRVEQEVLLNRDAALEAAPGDPGHGHSAGALRAAGIRGPNGRAKYGSDGVEVLALPADRPAEFEGLEDLQIDVGTLEALYAWLAAPVSTPASGG